MKRTSGGKDHCNVRNGITSDDLFPLNIAGDRRHRFQDLLSSENWNSVLDTKTLLKELTISFVTLILRKVRNQI